MLLAANTDGDVLFQLVDDAVVGSGVEALEPRHDAAGFFDELEVEFDAGFYEVHVCLLTCVPEWS